MNDHAFCRESLKQTMTEVREHFTPAEIEKAWVWTDGGGDYFEFHGPNNEYEYNLKSDCLWGARADGWRKLLDAKQGQ